MKRIALFLVLASACIAQPLQFVDRYQGTLASGYTSGGGTLSITSATSTVGSAVLPSGASYYILNVRAEGANTDELFLVTNRSSTTLTVTGAQASTSASNHASGAVITATIMTAAAYAQMKLDVLNNPTVTGQLTISDPSNTTSIGYTGKTSGSTVTTTVSDTTGTGALTFPGATGNVNYITTPGTAGHGVQIGADGIGLVDTGSAAGSTTGIGPSAYAYNTGAITGTGSFTATYLPLNTNAWDTGSIHSTSVNTSRFTAPSTGYYQATCGFQTAATSSYFLGMIQVNHADVSPTAILVSYKGDGTNGANMIPTAILYMTSGDYMECVFYNTGTTVNINAHQGWGQLTKVSTSF